jgi:hypothetical protein
VVEPDLSTQVDYKRATATIPMFAAGPRESRVRIAEKIVRDLLD